MNNEYSDEQLIELVHENNEDAKSILFNRYNDLINYLIRKYTPLAKTLGIDINDLYQEALVSFTDAILNYDSNKDAAVRSFVSLCVERKIKKTCIKAGRQKNQAIKDSLSLDYTYQDLPLKELIEDVDSDPLIKVSENESFEELMKNIKDVLTAAENEVFELLRMGLSYRDISEVLDKEPKQIDNAIQRIKTKIKKILSERN